ncbi:MAG: hypothetical protein ABFD91_16520 [Anaerohalosphaeraceae bacterium]
MSQLVEPVEVTYKRAAILWWNMAWPIWGSIFLLQIPIASLFEYLQSWDNLFVTIFKIGLGLFWIFMVIWVHIVVVQGLFKQKFRGFKIMMVTDEPTAEETSIREIEETVRKQMEQHHNIT